MKLSLVVAQICKIWMWADILGPIPYIWGFCTLPTFLLRPGVTQRQLADSNSSE